MSWLRTSLCRQRPRPRSPAAALAGPLSNRYHRCVTTEVPYRQWRRKYPIKPYRPEEMSSPFESAPSPCPPPVVTVALTTCRDPRGHPVTLNERETKLFERVLTAVAALELDVRVRVAGGWVRDKLLGVDTMDIDFVLDTMSGVEFAQRVTEHINQNGPKTASRVTAIKANPDQSKHLETATFVIDGISIDANRFRDEVYNGDSRIPVIRPSSAIEDAQRRDFTINALFYNIHTGDIEDHVHGIRDLGHRLVRTPTDPLRTFTDDPLRILRAIRFASRLNFDLDQSLVDAARAPSVQLNLLGKVSRERYGIEMKKMMDNSATFYHSLELLTQWKLRSKVFLIDSQLHSGENFTFAIETNTGNANNVSDENSDISTLCMRCCQRSHSLMQSLSDDDYYLQHPDHGAHLLLYSYLAPYYGYTVAMKKKFEPVAGYLLGISLKWPNVEAKRITEVSRLAFNIAKLAHSTDTQSVSEFSALTELGQILIELGPSNWRIGLDLAKSFELVWRNANGSVDRLESLMKSKTVFHQVPLWEMKPELTGDELKLQLAIKQGPLVSKYKHWMMDWQIQQFIFHPLANSENPSDTPAKQLATFFEYWKERIALHRSAELLLSKRPELIARLQGITPR